MPSRGRAAGQASPKGTEYALKTSLVLRESTGMVPLLDTRSKISDGKDVHDSRN